MKHQKNETQRRLELAERVFGYLSECFSADQLYDILHHTLGMSTEDMELLQFDLQEQTQEKVQNPLFTKAIFESKRYLLEPSYCEIVAIEEMDGTSFEEFSKNLLNQQEFISRQQAWIHEAQDGTIHGLLVLNTESGDGILVNSSGYDYARYTAFMPNIKEYVDKQISLVVEQIVADAIGMSDETEYAFDCESTENYYGLPVTENNGIGAMLLRELQNREEFSEIEVEEDVFYMKLKDEFKQEQTVAEPTMSM